MTTWNCPDGLENNCEKVDFRGFQLVGILTGDIRIRVDSRRGKRYLFHVQPRRYGADNLHIHQSMYRLSAEGRLTLYEFRYHRHPARGIVLRSTIIESVHEELTGNFWIQLGNEGMWSFFGPHTYVPFRNGLVVQDRSEWVEVSDLPELVLRIPK